MGELAQRLKYYRKLRKMSVRALADKADVSVSYVYAIEAGARGSNITKLNQISDALDVALSELLGQEKRRE